MAVALGSIVELFSMLLTASVRYVLVNRVHNLYVKPLIIIFAYVISKVKNFAHGYSQTLSGDPDLDVPL